MSCCSCGITLTDVAGFTRMRPLTRSACRSATPAAMTPPYDSPITTLPRESSCASRRKLATSSTTASKLASLALDAKLTSCTRTSNWPPRPGNWTNGLPFPPSRPGM
eukprot:scaffold3984_cov65-Phaeocystis_antarctica.AAC.3